jgi:hypothetical protein
VRPKFVIGERKFQDLNHFEALIMCSHIISQQGDLNEVIVDEILAAKTGGVKLQ